ncbi:MULTISPECIES: NAD-dependent epimerase/dehydratase family protein [unclassified Sphingobium]|uniref:NAD-dependent epimerase/dehydratase family protein n=1 Tax=unclassified Sphingobium TaxID=2611147 RepID=UPI000D165543|nr:MULTISPECIES: NAD-dependent epimerase/dehydratase family protein [unclassified Sphingobium]PSO09724.1 hypothetical protein C7E20_21100 [Sphingobium sp. AEW4]TWD19048.1 UDP-glucose 4-epimerase [Sphingobium sp. AEW013]
MPGQDSRQKKVVVLGGTGFIGLNLLNHLALDRNVDLQWVKRRRSSCPAIIGLPDPRIIEDFENIDLSWLSEADVIVDLVSSGRGRTAQQRNINKRIGPHLRMIDGLLDRHSSAHYIYLSSAGTIYGNTDQASLNEQSPCHPQTEYGLEKMIVETSLLSAARNGLDVSILRVANAYGRGQAIKPGFGVIPTMISALQTGSVFTVLGSGEMQRDYVNVIDVQNAISAAIHTGGTGILNIATGQGTSLNRLVSLIEELSGRKLNRINTEPDRTDPNFARFDISLARDVLQWQPMVSLREGLSQILRDAGLIAAPAYDIGVAIPSMVEHGPSMPSGSGRA